MTTANYVEKEGTVYRIQGSRVSLDSIVHGFRNGETPESIVQMYPTLSLEQVYGAITYYLAHQSDYLAHQSDLDAYLNQGREDHERQREEARAQDPEFYRRLAEAKTKRLPTR